MVDLRPWPEIQEYLPALSSEEKEKLRRGIKNGVVNVPILHLPDGRIIDGHHRWEFSEHTFPFLQEVDISEEQALALAIGLNIDRRQMSKEQIEALQEKIRHDKEAQKKIADGLRKAGKTQAETAALVGVAQQTIDSWENDYVDTMPNTKSSNENEVNNNAPDYRVVIPPSEYDKIYCRWQAGETQDQIAADYKVDQSAIAKIIKKIKGREKSKEEQPRETPITSKSPVLIISHAEYIPQIASESVDLIITSPPYNLGGGDWPMGGNGRTPRTDGVGFPDQMPEDEYQAWQIQCLKEMYRVAKLGASLFYNHKVRNRNGRIIHPMDWLRDHGNLWIIRQEIIWDRRSTHNHSPQLFWPEDERIYWMTKGRPILPDRPIGMSTIWEFHGPQVGTWHPAPFGEELPRRCIEAIGRDDITVLDPFAGSCTTLKVALQYGYDAIGVDISADYLEQARIENGWAKAEFERV